MIYFLWPYPYYRKLFFTMFFQNLLPVFTLNLKWIFCLETVCKFLSESCIVFKHLSGHIIFKVIYNHPCWSCGKNPKIEIHFHGHMITVHSFEPLLYLRVVGKNILFVFINNHTNDKGKHSIAHYKVIQNALFKGVFSFSCSSKKPFTNLEPIYNC